MAAAGPPADKDDSLRMGVKVSFTNLAFSFSRLDATKHRQFWIVPDGQLVAETPMANCLIFVPVEPSGPMQYARGVNGVDWKSKERWGMIVLGENHQMATSTLQRGNLGRSNLRLLSSTQYIHDASYWVLFRLATKAFYTALNTLQGRNEEFKTTDPEFTTERNYANKRSWIAARKLLETYNAQIEKLVRQFNAKVTVPAEMVNVNKWKLRFAPQVLEFGTPGGGKWQPYISLDPDKIDTEEKFYRETKTAINYEADLQSLFFATDIWTGIWQHMHCPALFTAGDPLIVDPPIGLTSYRKGATNMIFPRNAVQSQFWKAARLEADRFFRDITSHPDAGVARVIQQPPDPRPLGLLANMPLEFDGERNFTNRLKGLIMIIFASASVVPYDEYHKGLPRNAWTQLCKSSPTSIVRALIDAYASYPQYNVPARLRLLDSDWVAERALASVLTLRTVEAVRPFLPPSKPFGIPRFPTHRENVDLEVSERPIVEGSPAAGRPFFRDNHKNDFKAMWRNVFIYNGPLDRTNNFGYQQIAPFFCRWAVASTTRPAAAYLPILDSYNPERVKVTFQSPQAYFLNRLNLGFNPEVVDEYFTISYQLLLRMVNNLSGPLQDKINALLTSDIGRKAAGDPAAVRQLLKQLDTIQRGDPEKGIEPTFH